MGGRSGKLVFKHVDNNNPTSTTPKFIAIDGSIGQSGKNGKTCENLALDIRVDTELRKLTYLSLTHITFYSDFTVLHHSNSSKCSPVYVKGNEPSDEQTEANRIATDFSVIRYKRFLLETMRNASLTTNARKMYRAIDEDHQINDEYSLKALVMEACELETNYADLIKSMKVIPLYRRLLRRIKSKKNSNGRNKNDKLTLSYLRSIVQHKLNDLRVNNDIILSREPDAVLESIKYRNETLPAIANDGNDDELQRSLNELRMLSYGNFILAKYNHVIEVFRLTYFPFAADYLETYTLPTTLSAAYDDLDDIYFIATYSLRALRESIKRIMSNNEEIMLNLNFVDRTDSRNAFFVWKNSNFRDEIRKLFEGKKITLLADVKQSDKRNKFNAMKFNTIELAFRSSNETVNVQLNDALKGYELKLNHTGVSASRCNGKFFEITHNPVSMLTSFLKDKDEDPMTRSGSYDLLKYNQAMLSPYALWEIQIVQVEEAFRSTSRNITELAKFGQMDIDIELHGTGKFISENIPICESENLTKFYTQI